MSSQEALLHHAVHHFVEMKMELRHFADMCFGVEVSFSFERSSVMIICLMFPFHLRHLLLSPCLSTSYLEDMAWWFLYGLCVFLLTHGFFYCWSNLVVIYIVLLVPVHALLELHADPFLSWEILRHLYSSDRSCSSCIHLSRRLCFWTGRVCVCVCVRGGISSCCCGSIRDASETVFGWSVCVLY